MELYRSTLLPSRRRWFNRIAGRCTALLKRLGMSVRPTDVTLSCPGPAMGVRFMGRSGVRTRGTTGFFMHYHILKDRLIITVMPGIECGHSNETIAKEIRLALDDSFALFPS